MSPTVACVTQVTTRKSTLQKSIYDLNIMIYSLIVLLIFSFTQVTVAKVLVTYYPSWSVYRNFTVGDIQAQYHSHIIYAFAKIVDNEIALVDPYADIGNGYTETGTQFDGSLKRLLELKQQNPTIRTLIAVGGWTLSGNFSSMASTATTRQIFATSCARFIEKYGFDGVDIDWEYPTSIQDRQSYTMMLADLRNEFDRLPGTKRIITATIPASPNTLQYFDLVSIQGVVDFINVMTYDFFGAWSPTTGHQANLYSSPAGELSVDSSLNYIKSVTGSLEKMVMGIPAYGRAWGNVSVVNNGTGQAFGTIPPGSYESGVFDFKDIVNFNSSYTRFYDDTIVASWIYNPSSQVYITYDDPTVITKKAEYVLSSNMLGMMIWDSSGDSGLLARSAFAVLNQPISTTTSGVFTTTPSSSITTTPQTTTVSETSTTTTSLALTSSILPPPIVTTSNQISTTSGSAVFTPSTFASTSLLITTTSSDISQTAASTSLLITTTSSDISQTATPTSSFGSAVFSASIIRTSSPVTFLTATSSSSLTTTLSTLRTATSTNSVTTLIVSTGTAEFPSLTKTRTSTLTVAAITYQTLSPSPSRDHQHSTTPVFYSQSARPTLDENVYYPVVMPMNLQGVPYHNILTSDYVLATTVNYQAYESRACRPRRKSTR